MARCMLIDADDTKAYRFLDKDTDKIIISRDARFIDENIISTNSDIKKDNEDNIFIRYNPEPEEELQTTSAKKDEKLDKEKAQIRKSDRTNKGVPPLRLEYTAKLAKIDISEPKTIAEALSRADKDQWKAAMDQEIASLKRN
ncbi:hypothetical protein KPH14_012969, partial [Odynerus spinipes]